MENPKKDLPIQILFAFLYLLVSGLTASLVSLILTGLVNGVVGIDYTVRSGLACVILTLAFLGMLFFLSYHEGYHTASYIKSEWIPASAIASGIYFLLGILFHFSPVFFGATRHIAGLIELGNGYQGAESVSLVPLALFLVVGLLTAVLWTIALIFSRKAGVRKRLCDRAALTGEGKEN